MKNKHNRLLKNRTMLEVRPWLEFLWTGTERDLFPVDFLQTFRRNPDGTRNAQELIPGVTRMGHGPLTFVFDKSGADFWKVKTPYSGWHGFRLVQQGNDVVIEHEIEMQLSMPMQHVWTTFIEEGHDFVIEALFDRLEYALRNGSLPKRTDRTVPLKLKCLSGFLKTFNLTGGSRLIEEWFASKI